MPRPLDMMRDEIDQLVAAHLDQPDDGDSTRWSERSDALWRAINEVANGYGWTLSSISIDHNTRTFTCELVPLVRISVKREIP